MKQFCHDSGDLIHQCWHNYQAQLSQKGQIQTVCYKLTATWAPQQNCQLADSFGETCGVTKNGSGRRNNSGQRGPDFGSCHKHVEPQVFFSVRRCWAHYPKTKAGEGAKVWGGGGGHEGRRGKITGQTRVQIHSISLLSHDHRATPPPQYAGKVARTKSHPRPCASQP